MLDSFYLYYLQLQTKLTSDDKFLSFINDNATEINFIVTRVSMLDFHSFHEMRLNKNASINKKFVFVD